MEPRPRPGEKFLLTTALCALTAFLAFAPDAAEARDRPGTPNNLTSSPCKSSNGSPAVCIEFANTASERVYFESELTINGQLAAERPEADCVERRTPPTKPRICVGGAEVCAIQQARNVQSACHAGRSFNGRRTGDEAEGKTGEFYESDTGRLYVHPEEAFKIVNLDYETEYCVRFRARRVSDQVVSASWSNWSCATTPAEIIKPRVRKPGPPSGLTAEFVPGGKDFRIDPPKILVTWGPGANATSHSITKLTPGRGFVSVTPAQGSDGNANRIVDELTLDEVARAETEGITYQVCAFNEAGRACSEKSSFGNLGGVVGQSKAGKDIYTDQAPGVPAPAPATIPHADDMVAVPDAIKVLVKPGKYPTKQMMRGCDYEPCLSIKRRERFLNKGN